MRRLDARHLHLAFTILWALAVYPTIMWWRDSILWVAFMSLWANVASHWASFEAARASKKIDDI